MAAASAIAHDAPAPIDGLQPAGALRSGIYRLFEQADHLNKINVFPVPDGDTGTNLAMTLSAVLAAIERSPEPDVGWRQPLERSPAPDSAHFAAASITGAAYARQR